MSPYRSLLTLLAWCLVFKTSQCDPWVKVWYPSVVSLSQPPILTHSIPVAVGPGLWSAVHSDAHHDVPHGGRGRGRGHRGPSGRHVWTTSRVHHHRRTVHAGRDPAGCVRVLGNVCCNSLLYRLVHRLVFRRSVAYEMIIMWNCLISR